MGFIIPTSQFRGNIGERLREISVNCISIRPLEYGGYCYLFKSTKGDYFSWFTQKNIPGLYSDKPLRLTGTVKDHKTITEGKTTILTRCIIKDDDSRN